MALNTICVLTVPKFVSVRPFSSKLQSPPSNCLLYISIWMSHRCLKFNIFKIEIFHYSSLYLLPYHISLPLNLTSAPLLKKKSRSHPIRRQILLILLPKYILNLPASFHNSSLYHNVLPDLLQHPSN